MIEPFRGKEKTQPRVFVDKINARNWINNSDAISGSGSANRIIAKLYFYKHAVQECEEDPK
jgi:hypothetical protein